MDDNPISKKALLLVSGISVIIMMGIFIAAKTDYTTVVFCDVGQGDGIYIRTSSGTDILIDAGPDKEMLLCLGKHMPFYDHTLEYVLLSHAHYDHYGGLTQILDRYNVNIFAYSFLAEKDHSFEQVLKKLKASTQKVSIKGTDVLNIDTKAKITFLWPTFDFISQFDEEKDDLNDTSLVALFSQSSFDMLLTGDVSPQTIPKIISSTNRLGNVEVLKVPHHGSKNGLTKNLLEETNPVLSVISVGERNKFGHPSPEIKEMFRKTGRKYVTTSEFGSVVIDVYERGWKIRNDLFLQS